MVAVETSGDGRVQGGAGDHHGVQLAQQAGGDGDACLGVGQRVIGAAGEVSVAGGQYRVVLQRGEHRPPGGQPQLGAAAGAHRESAIIDHPPGEETQFDWLELPDPPAGWGLAGPAHLLVGSLAHSSRWRAVLAESEDQAHLIEALDGVVRRLGGVSRYWRFDRMATVCHPGSGRVTASFAAVARHYGAGVKICPSRRGQRKGVVEKANHSAAQRWWRTLADEHTMVGAQADLDRFCARVGDVRTRRRDDGGKVTVAELAAAEPLLAAPTAPYPAVVAVTRTVSAQALVAFRGNTYSVPPGMSGRELIVSTRLGSGIVEVATEGPAWDRGGRGGAGAAPPRPRRRRRGGPRHRARRRAGGRGAGRVHRPGGVSGQDPPAAVAGGPGRGRPAARRTRSRRPPGAGRCSTSPPTPPPCARSPGPDPGTASTVEETS